MIEEEEEEKEKEKEKSASKKLTASKIIVYE